MVLVRPNREKPASKATKAAVVLLLLISAALILIVTVGGWAAQSSIKITAIFSVALYLLMAFFVLRWSRGMLAMAAGIAILFAIVSAVAVPAWFARDKTGFDDPLLPAGLLGLLTLIIVPVQLLLIAFSIRGFNQAWNVEVEVTRDEAEEGVGDKFDDSGVRIDGEHGEGGDKDYDDDQRSADDGSYDDTSSYEEQTQVHDDEQSSQAAAGGPAPARNPHLGRGPTQGADTGFGGDDRDADLRDESRAPGSGDQPRS